MLIGLIADTHIGVPSEKLPPQVKEVFHGVGLILHAGDIWIPSVLDELESIAPVIAAWGDDDAWMSQQIGASLESDTRMLEGHILHLEGITLWLKHIKPDYKLINLKEGSYSCGPSPRERKDPPDVVVFGHTHFPEIKRHESVLLVNPGSLTFPNYVPRLGTVALMTINSGQVEACIVQL